MILIKPAWMCADKHINQHNLVTYKLILVKKVVETHQPEMVKHKKNKYGNIIALPSQYLVMKFPIYIPDGPDAAHTPTEMPINSSGRYIKM